MRRCNVDGSAHCRVLGHCVVSCALKAEPIKMLFGMWTQLGSTKHALDGVYIGVTWQILLNRSCVTALCRFCTSLFTNQVAK